MGRAFRLTETDHERVTAAVTEAERGTDGEVVTIVTARSDSYHDVILYWATMAVFLTLAVIAFWPALLLHILDTLEGGWVHEIGHTELLVLVLAILAIKFVVARLLFGWMPLRLFLTPPAVKAKRVRRRAVEFFRAATERRTRSRTGVLLFLSLAEHRAEIVADEAVHGRVAPEMWGDAMAALVDAVRDGRPGDGMAAAVARIGAILAEHFPKTGADVNELPDRLIEL